MQHGEIALFEGCGDAGLVDAVVVAEGAEAEVAGEAAEDFGADFGVLTIAGPVACGGGDEIAGERDEVRFERVDALYDAAEEVVLVEAAVVEIGDLRDAEAVEGGRQVCDGGGVLDDGEMVAVEFGRVDEQGSGGDGGGAEEEVAAGWATRMPRIPAHSAF